jgi:Ribbon-helix-helix protein, copG family
VSRRTQITLTDRQHALLRDEAARSGLSMAELVRRAVDRAYRPKSRPKLSGFEMSLALWREPDAAVFGRRVVSR